MISPVETLGENLKVVPSLLVLRKDTSLNVLLLQ